MITVRNLAVAAATIGLVAAQSVAHSEGLTPLPLPGWATGPVPLDVLRTGNPAMLSLNGTWKFQLTRGAYTRAGFVSTANGPVSASSAQNGHPAEDALKPQDPTGKQDIRWCASGEDMPQFWQADLSSVQDLRSLGIQWEFDSARYSYTISISKDARTWQPLLKQGLVPGSQPVPAFQPVHTRYVRINITAGRRSNGPVWACIKHIDINVRKQGAAADVAWQPSPRKAPTAAALNQFASPAAIEDPHDWKSIPVPANWEMQGFSRPTYDGPDDAVGLYRRKVDVPQSFAGKRVLWHFEGVWDSAELFINGVAAGVHESGYTAFDVDITRFIKPGTQNLLALRVCKTTPSVDLDTGDYWSLGGIYRDTSLKAVPQTHFSGVVVRTDLDAQYVNSRLTVKTEVQGVDSPTQVTARLFTSAGTPVQTPVLTGVVEPTPGKKTATVTLSGLVMAPRLWSAEKPDLYYVVLTLSQNGKVLERAEERFGFRKIEIKSGVVNWNGKPIKCTGVCRHEEWAALGHAITENAWRTDLRLMKAANVNAVRTSHYNHAGRFIELCDEVGIYVLDEVPACWCNLSDLSLTPAFVQRTRETLDRDKNRPCVLAWSLANESGYGPNAAAMLDYVKTNDPTRLAFVSQCGPWNNPKIDLHDTHYPSIEDVRRMAAEPLRKTTPLVMTEQPHIFYVADGLRYDYGEKDFWGEVLAANWKVVWATPSIMGSFVWEWQDQGIADRFPDNGRDASGLRGNNTKGIVDGYRNVKPEYWNLKMVYSPVNITTREAAALNGKLDVPVENRYSFTDLSELRCEALGLRNGTVFSRDTVVLSCQPGKTCVAHVPVRGECDSVRLTFTHRDGREITSCRIHVSGALRFPEAPSAPAAAAPALSEKDGVVLAYSGDSVLAFDKITGVLKSWKVAGTDLVSGPMQLNLGQRRANHGDHGASNFLDYAGAPELKSMLTEAVMEAGKPVVRTNALVSLNNEGPLARLLTTWTVQENGAVHVQWTLKWASAAANCWELGMALPVPSRLNTLQWARDAQWTEYPKGHIGETYGVAASSELTFRCSKHDVRWASLSGASGPGLCALPAEMPLHTRVGSDKGTPLLYLCSAISPPYDFSTNLLPEKLIKLKQGETVSGDFVLRPVVK